MILLVVGHALVIVVLGAVDVLCGLRAGCAFVIAFSVLFAFAHFYTPFFTYSTRIRGDYYENGRLFCPHEKRARG
jgi:hypothetical protein